MSLQPETDDLHCYFIRLYIKKQAMDFQRRRATFLAFQINGNTKHFNVFHTNLCKHHCVENYQREEHTFIYTKHYLQFLSEPNVRKKNYTLIYEKQLQVTEAE